MQNDIVTIEIPNFEKYNPRGDVKRPSWFRLNNDLLIHPVISSLTCQEFRLWITLLAECSRQNKGKSLVTNTYQLSNSLKMKQKSLIRLLYALEQYQLLTLKHVTSTYADVTSTYRYTTLQDRTKDKYTARAREESSQNSGHAEYENGTHDAEAKKREGDRVDQEISNASSQEKKRVGEKTGLQSERVVIQQDLLPLWINTLSSFGISSASPSADLELLRLAKKYGVDEIRLAIVGQRHEPSTENFKPRDHISLARLWRPHVFEKLRNLGARQRERERKQAEDAAVANGIGAGGAYGQAADHSGAGSTLAVPATSEQISRFVETLRADSAVRTDRSGKDSASGNDGS